MVVLANLKARNMRGVKSNGMLLAASDASHETVELLQPPAEAVPGQRLWFGEEGEGDAQKEAATPNQAGAAGGGAGTGAGGGWWGVYVGWEGGSWGLLCPVLFCVELSVGR